MSVVVFGRNTPASTMARRRRAWRLGEDGYRVIGRGGTGYQVRMVEGKPVCNCPAADFGLDCWHQARVTARLRREARS